MKKLAYVFLLLISLVLYTLTIRGNLGNPSPHEIEYVLNNSGGPFETSQERSRYAIILSMYHDKSFSIDNFASMGTPDVGQIKGHYYSLFPFGASLIAYPLFLLGQYLGAAQMATFSATTIFTILTMIVMVKFGNKLGLPWSVSLFSALAYGFATNAWGYSVTLVAHPFSAFLIMSAIYLTAFASKNASIFRLFLVWCLYSFAVYLDFPNLFIFLPIVGLLSFDGLNIIKNELGKKLSINLKYVIAPFIFVALLIAYGFYNYTYFGSPLRLSNALPRVQDLKDEKRANPEETNRSGSDPVAVLQTRNMLEGFHSFSISHDRGMLVYTPVALLSLFALGYLKKQKRAEFLLYGVPITCLTLYTMFGDPYGGWAFGSRYMMAVLPALCILAGAGLFRFTKNIFVKLIYTLVFAYSAGISLLAPITTNVIPPLVEARTVGLDSWFIINWRMILKNESNSFFYNHILNNSIPLLNYYIAILSAVILVGTILIWYRRKSYELV